MAKPKNDVAAAEAANEQVQKTVDAEEEKGLRGVEVDPTPNENYTVDGVLAGKPTPETDADAKERARKGTV